MLAVWVLKRWIEDLQECAKNWFYHNGTEECMMRDMGAEYWKTGGHW